MNNDIPIIKVGNRTVKQNYFKIGGDAVMYKINVLTTPSYTGTYYGECKFFNPHTNNWVIFWFSHTYKTPNLAWKDCIKHQLDHMEENPEL